jgi:hypothetical protein
MKMTEQEIIEGNKLIAVFMGCELLDFPKTENYIGESWYCGDFLKPFDDRTPAKVRTELLKFNSDWNWLMPVADKIEKLSTSEGLPQDARNRFFISIKTPSGVGYITKDDTCKMPVPTDARVFGESRIESTWLAVVAFIKWLNQNKK